jgi:two-component system OmpR family sensor kinase
VRASTLADGQLLILAQPLVETESTLGRLLRIELLVTGGAVLIALGAGFWLVRLGLRPLRAMEATAGSIAAGNLTERVPGENDKTEVGRLARTLNVMLTRIEAAFSARVASEQRLRESDARLRRFVADASHELRTPIAAVSAYAELFGRGASEQKEDLERLMQGIVTETGRMEHLVADLLLLARLDDGRPLDLQPVDVVALCAEAVQTAQTVGPGWPVRFTAPRPIEVVGDATGLRQVVDNLLGNVRAHTPEGTATVVSVDANGAGVTIAVADNGPGMTADQVAHVFDRFYRSDPSRSRLHGGAGLGLSIVSAIVTAHGGTVEASSVEHHGTTVTVRLPVAPSSAAGP